MVKNIIKNGIASGIPKPNGIINNITIIAAKPINIRTIISTMAPIADLNVS